MSSLWKKKITESARAVHRGNYAETVKYAGCEGSGHILKAQPKQTPCVCRSSPWQRYLVRPSLGRKEGRVCVCRGLPVSAPLSAGSCPSCFLSPSLGFGWHLELRQRGGIFSESSSLPCSGREQPVSMPSYVSFLWQNIFLIFQINFFSFSVAGLWLSPGLAVVPAAGQAGFPAHLWSLSPPAYLHPPSAIPGTDG